jgi:hypothetical protein
MKKTIIAIAIATFAVTAIAQADNTSAGATANASVSGTSATSISAPVVTPIQGQGMIYNEASQPANTRNNIDYSGSYELKNVPAVAAPALTTTLTETCMGSSSVGGAGVGFGFSIGTTWRDTACVRRLDSRQVAALGYRDAARELMCDSPAVAAAFERAGMPSCGAGVAAAPAEKAIEPTPALGHPMFDAQ